MIGVSLSCLFGWTGAFYAVPLITGVYVEAWVPRIGRVVVGLALMLLRNGRSLYRAIRSCRRLFARQFRQIIFSCCSSLRPGRRWRLSAGRFGSL
jgi:hypothetical protein